MMEKSMSVYIIDDEYSVVEWLVNRVEWSVYNCQVVGYSTNAEEALAFLQKHSVELLITDICMPNLSGLELIRLMKERYPNMFVLVVSAYDKFSYVKEAFQYGIVSYCLKPIDINELYDCIKAITAAHHERYITRNNQNHEAFRNSIFQRLIHGDMNNQRIEEQCELAGLPLDVKTFRIGMIDTSGLEKEQYISLLKQFEMADWKNVYFFLDSYMNLVLVFWGGTDHIQKVENDIKSFLYREQIISQVHFCVGREQSNYQKLAESYQICLDFSRAALLFPNYLIRTEEYPYEKYRNPMKGKEQKLLENCLKVEQADALIDAIGTILFSCMNETERQKELVCIMVYLVKNLKLLYPMSELPKVEGTFHALGDYGEILERIRRFYQEAIFQNEKFIHPYVNTARQEINRHYMDKNLSLQTIANLCHVSADYLGKLFKKQTGEFFNDCLMQQRLKRAEALLYENKMRIGEIATAVGFSSQSYFSKMFRRL